MASLTPTNHSALTRWPPWSRWLGLGTLLLLLPMLLLVGLAVVGVDLDINAERAMLARMISARVGREVRIDGPVKLRLGLRPQLRLQHLALGQPKGFAADDFLRVGQLELKLDLIPLLSGRYRADRVAARDVRLVLQQRDDDSNNWTFNPQNKAADDDASFDAKDVAGIDIRQIDLDNIIVTFQSGAARPFEFRLDQLDAALPAGGGITLKAKGMVERTLPYQLNIDGGPLADLLRGKPGWPVSMQLGFADGVLAVQGKLGEKGSALSFGLGAPDLATFGKVIGVKLPNAGAAGLSGEVALRPGLVRLERVSAMLGKSSMAGWMQLDARTETPKLTGSLAIITLDLRPFLGQDDQDEPPTDLRALYKSLERVKLDLQAMDDIDADLQLGVGQWLSLPGDIRHASMRLQASKGKLEVPVEASIEQVPMRGLLVVDARQSIPSLSLSFNADKSPIGGLSRFLLGVPGIDGQLGALSLSLNARGARGDALMRSLKLSMQLKQSRLSYGNVDGGKPVSFTLDHMLLGVGGDQPLDGKLQGSLLGRPLSAVLSGASLRSAIEQGSSPVSLTVQTGRISARVSGRLEGADQSADLTFALGAERAGDVAHWLGLNPKSDLPIALAGRMQGNLQRWSLSNLVFQVGDSSLYSELDQTTTQSHQRLNAKLTISSVDLQQLDKLLPPPAPAKAGTPASLDIPILPAKLVLEDADVSVRARDIRGSQLALGEMGFDGRVRDGYMQSSPFFAHIAGTRYEGAIMLDLRDAEPHAQLWLSAAPVDVSQALRQLKLSKNIDAAIERLTLYIDTRSRNLSTLMANASVLGEINGGRFSIRDENTQAQLQVQVSQGTLLAKPGERVTLALTGAVDNMPLSLRLRSATLKALAEQQRRIPFELAVETSKTKLLLSGSVDRDLDARDIELALDVRGDRLDSLDRLLRVSLPPWGPWSGEGKFRMNARGYAVDALRLQVGSSTLNGRGAIDTASGKSIVDIALDSPLIQLDDFKWQQWSAMESKPTADEKTDAASVKRKAVEASDQVQGLLSRQTLSKADATLMIRVEQVRSGKDVLGNGQLEARLLKGRAEIGPITVSMPGGEAKLRLSYEPREQDILADLKIDIDRFDYGVIGRRLKPESDLGGRFSVKMDVNGRAARLSQILKQGNGSVDIAVWPEKLPAGVFDLWAVNLFVALLPTLDPSNTSVVNCAVGRFALNEGKLMQKQLVIDTSRMRVNGTARVNFADEQVRVRLQPQAKTAQFLSLATPIEVNGSFDQFKVGPNPGDIMQTIARLATSIIWVPIQKLMGEKLPADGADVCKLQFANR
ncbi:MAG: AsmA family protein [Burkholderiaceae bacterium]